MRMWMLAGAALVAAPALAQTCAPTATVPGFAPGQAPMTDHLVVGQPVELGLKAEATTSYTPPLARPPVAGSFGGTFPLTITTAGTYRIALSTKAWIDVVRDGAPLVATRHQQGAPCTGVAKIVAFRLEPGRYDVQLSEATSSAIVAKVMHEAMIPAAK